MFIRNLIQTKQDFNRNFELNRVDTKYSDYQIITFASVVIKIKIENIEDKNDLFKLYRRLPNNEKVVVALDNCLISDSYMIDDALEQENKIINENKSYQAKKIDGCVAVLLVDYR